MHRNGTKSPPPFTRRLAAGLLMLPVDLASGLLLIPLMFLGPLCSGLIRFATNGGKRTFIPPSEYPWTPALESKWGAVRAELERVLKHLHDVPNYQDLSAAQKVLTQDDGWKSYVLSVFGWRIERNCQDCPETARILGEIPGLCYAMFSILKPHKHIPAHRGYYAGLLNCHLALVVPQESGACRLRVGPDFATWEEGRVLVFDDFNEHEAWNDSDSLRAVLLMYVVRPLPFPLSTMNRCLLAIAPWTLYARSLVRRAEHAAESRIGA